MSLEVPHLSAKDAFLSAEVGGQETNSGFQLKTQSQYFYQIQIQMFVTGLSSCDFVIWTTKGLFSTSVPFDNNFVTNVIDKLQTFWLAQVLPFMLQELPKTGMYQ